MTELRGVTCHRGSHSVTCYPTQVNVPRLNPSPQAGTEFIYYGGMEGWVDLEYPAMEQHGAKLRPLDHKSGCHNHYTTYQSNSGSENLKHWLLWSYTEICVQALLYAGNVLLGG